ncbi:MAG: hypothetical protein QG594_421, partial [Bacteroidota bacterium]|nr:hypothetical protein [Bacteroidota bacterium]
TGSSATRTAKKSIPCNGVKKSTTEFNEILRIVVDYLEGSYCKGGLSCGSKNSGETLWGLDRLNHVGPLDTAFWEKVDQVKNKPKKWNSSYPKPNDNPIIFNEYSKIIENDYNKFIKTYIKTPQILELINNDGLLKFNFIYATFNGSVWFKGFSKLIESEYNSGKRTSDELLKVFVDERISGGYNAIKGVKEFAAKLIADTGVDIQKLVGLSPLC